MFSALALTAHHQPPPAAGGVVVRAANDNHGRRVEVRLAPALAISVAEIEVFGALLAQLTDSANDNQIKGDTA